MIKVLQRTSMAVFALSVLAIAGSETRVLDRTNLSVAKLN